MIKTPDNRYMMIDTGKSGYNGGKSQAEMLILKYFKDNGIHKTSFALNRNTNPVSVLVECAYMINPEEYMRIRNKAVQKQIAKSIKNSIKKYIISLHE